MCCTPRLTVAVRSAWRAPSTGYRCHTAGIAGFPLSRLVVPMSVVLEELTICVGDGCANRFPDESGWDSRCPECVALWDDHATGQHDPPVDGCLLCR